MTLAGAGKGNPSREPEVPNCWGFPPFKKAPQDNFSLQNENYPLSQNDYRQEKIIFELFSGTLTRKSCKSPGGYYIIKFLGNYFSHPVRAPFLRNLCGSGTETGGGLLQDRGSYRKKCLGNYFRGLYIKIL